MDDKRSAERITTIGEAGLFRRLSPLWQVVLCIVVGLGLLVAINHIFFLRILPTKLDFMNSYLYLLLACFLSLVFILYPATKRASRTRVPWYDVLLFLSTFSICVYLAPQVWNVIHKGWDGAPPVHMGILSICLCFLTLEAVRRSCGLALGLIAALFAFYPVFAGYMPGLLQGIQFPLVITMAYHALGSNGILGLTTQAFGNIVIGFMVFGVVLVASGGGKFFLDLALAVFGARRGGPAKVAVVASGFFGSMSGSVIANVLTTGSVTIPAMKKAGYSPRFAGAVEACASTGGMFMPPVMGTVAFIMASLLLMPYWEVALAAAVPALLYYLGLFVQVDAYAVKHGLKGLERSEIPSLKETLKNGWPYVLAFVVLIYFLFLRLEGRAPFMASALLILLIMVQKEKRLHLKDLVQLFESLGQILSYVIAILAGLGFIIGTFTVTGLGHSFAHEVVALAGGYVPLLLFFGALASFILGMGMTVSACYIFLAIVLAPALVKIGFNPVAVHLFCIYWGMASYITPPVAVGAYTAAGMAGSDPMKTGYQAMRLGMLIYIIPFCFLFSPALVLQAPLLELILPFFTLALGILLLGSALEGYLIGLGVLPFYYRWFIVIPGVLLVIPNWQTDVIGIIMITVPIAVHLVRRTRLLAAKQARSR